MTTLHLDMVFAVGRPNEEPYAMRPSDTNVTRDLNLLVARPQYQPWVREGEDESITPREANYMTAPSDPRRPRPKFVALVVELSKPKSHSRTPVDVPRLEFIFEQTELPFPYLENWFCHKPILTLLSRDRNFKGHRSEW
jgi:hypothetical protein